MEKEDKERFVMERESQTGRGDQGSIGRVFQSCDGAVVVTDPFPDHRSHRVFYTLPESYRCCDVARHEPLLRGCDSGCVRNGNR